MVGLINVALVFRYREFPNVLSLFQYALFQRMWRQANASNMFSLAACVKARVYARSGVKHTGYANTCSPSATDVCIDPN